MGLFGKKTKKNALLSDEVEGTGTSAQANATTQEASSTGGSAKAATGTTTLNVPSGGDCSSSSSDESYDKVNPVTNATTSSTDDGAISSMDSSKLEEEIKQIYDGMGATKETTEQSLGENTTEVTDDYTEMTDSDTNAGKSKEDDDDEVNDITAKACSGPYKMIENTKAAGSYVQNQVEKLRTRAQEGPLPFSILAFLGGVAMVITNFLDLIFEVINLSPLASLMSIYCVIFGAVICKMEGRRWEMDTTSLPALFRNVGALKYVWGRGIFYIFAGTIQISKMHFDDLIVGTYICFVGIASIFVGRGTALKLSSLSNALDDKQVVCEKFMAYDSDDDGFLTYDEFQRMIKEIGLDLDHNELDVALFVVDQDQDDKISYEEFVAWWHGFHDQPGETVRTLV